MNKLNNFIEKDGKIVNNNWIEWEHISVPNQPDWLREIVRTLLIFLGHCMTCTALDGCYFQDGNKPLYPQHDNCDCRIKDISFNLVKKNAIAYCPIEKLTNYIFDEKKNKGKKELFESFGFKKENAYQLKNIFEKQALQEYINGNYILKIPDMFGPRISIIINLNDYKFLSGWMIEPNGKIRNITPFGGWI